MDDTIKLLAIDLGASSGRVMLGIYDGDKLQMEEIHRFENTPVQVNGHLYWDTLRLFHEMKQGVQKAFRQHGELTSLSVDTWGVDYGFIDKKGMMLYSPIITGIGGWMFTGSNWKRYCHRQSNSV